MGQCRDEGSLMIRAGLGCDLLQTVAGTESASIARMTELCLHSFSSRTLSAGLPFSTKCLS